MRLVGAAAESYVNGELQEGRRGPVRFRRTLYGQNFVEICDCKNSGEVDIM